PDLPARQRISRLEAALHLLAQMPGKLQQRYVVGISHAALALGARVGQYDVDVAAALAQEVDQPIDGAVGKQRVGPAQRKAQILQHDADLVLCGTSIRSRASSL